MCREPLAEPSCGPEDMPLIALFASAFVCANMKRQMHLFELPSMRGYMFTSVGMHGLLCLRLLVSACI